MRELERQLACQNDCASYAGKSFTNVNPFMSKIGSKDMRLSESSIEQTPKFNSIAADSLLGSKASKASNDFQAPAEAVDQADEPKRSLFSMPGASAAK